MNNLTLNVTDLTKFRKTLLSQYVFIEDAKKFICMPAVISLLNPVSSQTYTLLYNFLLKAAMLDAFKSYHYSDKQSNIACFLKAELLEEFKILKLFLIIIIDCGACRLSDLARKLIFSKNYIWDYSYTHITEKLKFIKNDITFFEHDLKKNSYESSKICIDNFLNCYEMLEVASNLEEKIIAVSKVLNVWHCNGPFFHKNYSKDGELNNPTAPFTKEQFDNLSNITPLQVEKEIKKLL